MTQPSEAARDALQAKQNLLRRGNGLVLPPAQRDVERRLDAIVGRGGARPAPGLAEPLVASTPQLPASYDDSGLIPHPEPLDLAKTLIGRASQGLSDGRSDQARSDLALAENELDGLSPDQLQAPQVNALREQAAALRRQLP